MDDTDQNHMMISSPKTNNNIINEKSPEQKVPDIKKPSNKHRRPTGIRTPSNIDRIRYPRLQDMKQFEIPCNNVFSNISLPDEQLQIYKSNNITEISIDAKSFVEPDGTFTIPLSAKSDPKKAILKLKIYNAFETKVFDAYNIPEEKKRDTINIPPGTRMVVIGKKVLMLPQAPAQPTYSPKHQVPVDPRTLNTEQRKFIQRQTGIDPLEKYHQDRRAKTGTIDGGIQGQGRTVTQSWKNWQNYNFIAF